MIIDLCDDDDNVVVSEISQSSRHCLITADVREASDDDFIDAVPLYSQEEAATRVKTVKVSDGKKRKNAQRSTELEARPTKKMQDQQLTGYYKHKELSLVMEDNLQKSPLGGEISATLLFSKENKNYGIFSAPSTIPGLCRWTYRSYMDGGNGNVCEDGVIVLPYVVVVYPPQVFIAAVMAAEEGSEFPGLVAEVSSMREKLLTKEYCPPDVKIVLMVVNIYEEALQYQRVGV